MTLVASSFPAFEITPETPSDAAAVEALLDRAFGPGRFTKVSERVREANRLLPDLSLTARSGGQIVGSVRLWPVRIGGAPCAFLGPLAVDPARQGEGIGQILTHAACEAATRAGWAAVLLVGHPTFFDKLGFSSPPAGTIRMPGPVDPRRIMLRPLRDGGTDGLRGEVVGDASLAG